MNPTRASVEQLAAARSYVEANVPLPADAGHAIGRTLALLGAGRPGHRQQVRVLVYGQSITRDRWAEHLGDYLREAFPHADIDFRNRAIGGFESTKLVRTLPHDVPPFYPDLVVLHDYGPQDVYEEIIRQIRITTAAEVIVLNDHLSIGQNDGWHDEHSWQFMPALAKRWDLELVDVRRAWTDYLERHRLERKALLRDRAHLNAAGNALMMALVAQRLTPALARRFAEDDRTIADPRGLVTTFTIGAKAHNKGTPTVAWRRGQLALSFAGNRVDLVQAGGTAAASAPASAQVLIDGRAPSEFPSLYRFTRPNDSPNRDWPWEVGALRRVDWRTPLVAEDWVLTLTSVSDGARQVAFELRGSRTGWDGRGSSHEPFVSRSGRVLIDPADWFLELPARRPYNVPIKPGFEIRWRALRQFQDTYVDPAHVAPDLDAATTVAQGLPNGPHRLVLRALGKTAPALTHIRIYRPLPPDRN